MKQLHVVFRGTCESPVDAEIGDDDHVRAGENSIHVFCFVYARKGRLDQLDEILMLDFSNT